MNIPISVDGQKLRVATNLKNLVAGTQEFIKFEFTLDEDWSALMPSTNTNATVFAQFTQNGTAYNVYLDAATRSVYLPSEIVSGSVTLMLYASDGTVHATTNVLTFTIDASGLIADASSTEITQSLYDQLVDMVDELLDIADSDYAEVIQQQITDVLDGYLENGDLARMTITDGSLTKEKLSADVQASLDNADNAWPKSQSTTSTPTTGSWEATYDTTGRKTDIFSYAVGQDTNTIQRIRGAGVTVNSSTQTFDVVGVDDTTYSYGGLDAALQGVFAMSTAYTNGVLASYSPITIQVVTQAELDALMQGAGAANTFYLVPRDNSSGYYNYEKYWYVDGTWDTFGASSTVIVDDLEDVTDPNEDTDYILATDNGYLYYKYIDDNWELVAGSSAEVIAPSYSIAISGYGTPTANSYEAADYSGEYYLNLTTLQTYLSNGTTWSTVETLATASELSDYYIRDANGSYIHYRYIDGKYEPIGTVTYTQEEIQALIDSSIDDMLNNESGTGIDDRLTEAEGTISSLQTTISNMANLVKDVTISADKTTITVTYEDDSTTTLTLDNGIDIDSTAYNVDDDYTLHFYDSNGDELEDLAVQITGGGGSGGTTGGTVTIGRVTASTVQCVYGDSCDITYTVAASDSSGDAVGSGSGTLYVNNVAVATGISVSTSIAGTQNTIDVGEYLTVGDNTVKISVSVDTGGESNTVATKTWTVTAINMYFTWNYVDSQINTSAVTDYYTPYGALSKTIYTFIDVEPVGFNPVIVDSLPGSSDDDFDADANYFLYDSQTDTYTHYVWSETAGDYVSGTGYILDVTTTTRSGVQQALTIPAQTHGSHAVVRYMTATVSGTTITTALQVHDMVFIVSGTTTPIIATSFNTAEMTQYNTVQIPIVVYDPSSTTTTVYLYEGGTLVSTWTGVDRTVHYWNYSPTTYGTKTLTITCGSTMKTITIEVAELDIDEAEVTGYDFRFKASEMATNASVQAWSGSYTPVGSSVQQTVDVTFSNNFDWVNGGLHTEYDDDGHLRQYFCVRAGTTMTFNYNLFGQDYDPKQYGKNFKFVFKAVNCRTYDAQVLSCMDNSAGNNGVGLVMTANNAVLTTANESLETLYCKDIYIEFETNIHPTSEYRYLQFWMDGSHDRNILYSADDGMQQVTPVGITIGSADCDVYIYMVKAYPTYLTNDNELSNFIMDAPNAYEMVDRYDRNDVLNASGEIDYTKLATQNPNLHVILLDLNRMSTGKKDNVVAYTARHIYNSGGSSHCFTVNNACVTIQGTSSVGYLESAGNVDINMKYNRTFTSDNVSYTTGSISFDDGSTSTTGYSMTDDSIAVDYFNVKLNVASSENANNACIADWYNTYQPWVSPAKQKNAMARDTIEFVPGAIFIRDRSGNLFSDTTGYHLYGICDMGNSKKNTEVFHDTTNPLACCVEVSNNTSTPCLMSSKTYTWNGDDEAVVTEDGEEQKVFEFRYVDDDSVDIAKSAWDRFVSFMYDYNPNLATNNALASSVTFGSYTFRGSGSYDTSSYDDDNVVYLYGYGLPTAYNSGIYSAGDYVTDASAETSYYYINYSNNNIYSSNGTTWTSIGTLTWSADTANVLAGTTISDYAGTYTTDSFNYRMAYLLEHCEEYMIMDPVIYHFVFIESFLMTDNVAKNTFWSSDDLVHWEPSKDYDNDTALGNDNVGGLSFTYGMETDDQSGSSYVFNAHDAAWITFTRGLFGACQTMYRNRESAGCFSTTNFLTKVQDWQNTRPERLWVADTQRKYLRPYEDNGTVTYIAMLAGRKTHQREQVKTYNAYYYASKYVSDFCTSQNIMVRGNTPTSGTTITVVPPANTATVSMYIDCYIVVASTSYNVVAKTRAQRGTTYTMDFSTIGSMGETELYFCTAPMITALGDLAHLYFKQNNFAMGTNLQQLEIGSSLTGYQNDNLESLTIGSNTMLEYLDVRNCPNVTGALDLSGCVSLSEVYLENTAFTGVTFATAGLLETAHLQNPTSLTMRELMYLQDLTLGSAANMTTLRIENCDFDSSAALTIAGTTTTHGTKDIALNLIQSCPNLSRTRLIGMDWSLSNTTDLESVYDMAGIDDDGYDITQSVLTGDAYVTTMRQSQLSKYNTVWPYLEITYGTMVTQYLATFLNADGTAILDTDGLAYTQWVDVGSAPYDPITMGYTITVSDSGTPAATGYDASSYNGDYYQDTSTGAIYLSDGTSWSTVANADILTPAMASTAQYIYTFSGWDDITTVMSYNRNVTAEYTTTTRTYTVKWYRDAGTTFLTVSGVPYGGCIDYIDSNICVGYGSTTPAAAGYAAADYADMYYQNYATGQIYYSNGSVWSTATYEDVINDSTLPTFADDESSYTFRVFRSWDKSTGFITGDVNVYADWIATNAALPAQGTDMSDMTVSQIYGIGKAGLQSSYFEDLDYTDIKLGTDCIFSNVDSITIGPKYYSDSAESTLSLTGVAVDQYLSGGYYFDGSTYYLSNIVLFDDDSPAFTMAIDFDFIGSTSGMTLLSANYGSTSNFRLYYDGTAPTIQWGDKTTYVGSSGGNRDIVVLRHPSGSSALYVYAASGTGNSSLFSTNVSKTMLTRTTYVTSNEPVTFGAVNYHTTSNTYRNYGTGHIHWMKIWYDDIGDYNAFALAQWPHEVVRMEYWGEGKYEYADGSGNVSNASFIANNLLYKRGYYMNSSNDNSTGWENSKMRAFCNGRLFRALPIEWRSIIRSVQINATAGSQSTSIITSNDKVYLPSYYELGGSGTGYNDEIGADTSSPRIPWFVQQSGSGISSYNTANAQRLKWRGRIRKYALGTGNTTAYDGNAYIYSCASDPAAYLSTDIGTGSIWINTGNSSIGYMFVEQDELDQYGITPAYTSDSGTFGDSSAVGGWVGANGWWERSPNLGNTTYFMYVSNYGALYYNNASYYYGVCLGFSI